MLDNTHIFWDGLGLDKPGSGIFTHCLRLLPHVKAAGVEPIFIGTAEQLASFPIGGAGIEVPKADGFKLFQDSKLMWPPRVEKRLLELAEARQVDPKQIILHGFANINLPVKANKNAVFKRVVTIHDLIPLVAKKYISVAYYKQFKYAIPRVMEAADAVIAVSKWTAESLAQLFPMHKHKIHMIPNGFTGMDPNQKFEGEALKTGSKLDLLTVSRYEKYKRLELIVEILMKKSNEYRWTLVTDAKGMAWAEKNASGLIKMGALKVVSNVPGKTLKKYYRKAHLLVHPSLFEGFCLPAAEALAAGTPVVYTGGSGIDETVGPNLGFALNSKHTVFDWIKVIEGSASMKMTQKFIFDLADWMNSAPSWGDSANKIVGVYKSL